MFRAGKAHARTVITHYLCCARVKPVMSDETEKSSPSSFSSSASWPSLSEPRLSAICTAPVAAADAPEIRDEEGGKAVDTSLEPAITSGRRPFTREEEAEEEGEEGGEGGGVTMNTGPTVSSDTERVLDQPGHFDLQR